MYLEETDMKLKRTAAAVLAAITAVSAASVCAFAEENKVEIATLDLADIHNGMTNFISISDGFCVYYTDNSKTVRGIFRIEKNNKGDLTYTDVETDVDFSKNLILGRGDNDGEYFTLAETNDDGVITNEHIMLLDKETDKASTVYTVAHSGSYTTNDGYSFAVFNGVLSLFKPDGTEVKIKDYTIAHVNNGTNDKYVAYVSASKDGNTEDCRVYGVDRDGKLTEIYPKGGSDVSVLACDGNQAFLRCGVQNPSFYVADLKTGAVSEDLKLGDLGIRVNDMNNGLLIYGGNRDVNGFIYDTKTQKFVNTDGITNIYTLDDGKTYLVVNEDDKFGYLDENGKQIGEWYDSAGEFIGGFAPVVKDGKCYIIDRNFNRVSDMVDGWYVGTYDDGLAIFGTDNGDIFLTYTQIAPEPAEDVPEKDNPETGSAGVALTLGLAAIAGAAAVVYRKKR